MRDPISAHERVAVVCAVAAGRRWSRTVRGFHVTVVRLSDPVLPVAWAVRFKGRWIAGKAPTVTAAIADVNCIISAGEKAFLLRCGQQRGLQGELFGGGYAHP